MIREAKKEDLEFINELLSELNQKIDLIYFDCDFNKAYIYEEKGIILFKKIDDFVEIEYIMVKENYRKKKIGSHLLQYLIDSLDNEKIISIFLEVNIKNDPAISFYKKHNFELISLRKNYYNRKEDALIMERRI
jgi:ribosomal protein S18 acetylase RimI-like enzyme